MKIEIPDEAVEQIVFQSLMETFDTFMQPSTDLALVGLSIEQMDDILGGAMNYAKWACAPIERDIINERWLAWKKYKMILEED